MSFNEWSTITTFFFLINLTTLQTTHVESLAATAFTPKMAFSSPHSLNLRGLQSYNPCPSQGTMPEVLAKDECQHTLQSLEARPRYPRKFMLERKGTHNGAAFPVTTVRWDIKRWRDQTRDQDTTTMDMVLVLWQGARLVSSTDLCPASPKVLHIDVPLTSLTQTETLFLGAVSMSSMQRHADNGLRNDTLLAGSVVTLPFRLGSGLSLPFAIVTPNGKERGLAGTGLRYADSEEVLNSAQVGHHRDRSTGRDSSTRQQLPTWSVWGGGDIVAAYIWPKFLVAPGHSVADHLRKHFANVEDALPTFRLAATCLIVPIGVFLLGAPQRVHRNFFHAHTDFAFPLHQTLSRDGLLDTSPDDVFVFGTERVEEYEDAMDFFEWDSTLACGPWLRPYTTNGCINDLEDFALKHGAGCVAFQRIVMPFMRGSVAHGDDDLAELEDNRHAYQYYLPPRFGWHYMVARSFADKVLTFHGVSRLLTPTSSAATCQSGTPMSVTMVQRRYGSRSITQLYDAARQVEVISAGLFRIRIVHMDEIVYQSQLSLVSSSHILVGVHGSALTLAAFMTKGQAVVQILPHAMCSWRTALEYQNIASAAGVAYVHYCSGEHDVVWSNDRDPGMSLKHVTAELRKGAEMQKWYAEMLAIVATMSISARELWHAILQARTSLCQTVVDDMNLHPSVSNGASPVINNDNYLW